MNRLGRESFLHRNLLIMESPADQQPLIPPEPSPSVPPEPTDSPAVCADPVLVPFPSAAAPIVFSEKPVQFECPQCRSTITTRVKRTVTSKTNDSSPEEPKNCTWENMAICIFVLCGGIPFLIIIAVYFGCKYCCFPNFKHLCPNCNSLIATNS